MRAFRNTVWRYYRTHGRPMPWRSDPSPYRVFVSEVMLQQTQVPRVLEKFPAFVATFPSFETLAGASPAAVIRAWQGLGYNRRALNLRRAAAEIIAKHGGILPRNEAALVTLPGIGPATAASIAAFAFNTPVVFLETNIRTVFIHHFFPNDTAVPDTDLLPLATGALPRGRVREWYWALMDYGAMLKKTVGNRSRQSKSYARQAPFAGSARKVRGAVLKAASHGPQSFGKLEKAVARDKRLARILADLEREGFLERKGGLFTLAGS